jgi:hypothetical protein
MRQPPSPLLLSARKRRPRRNPPRGQFGDANASTAQEPQRQQQAEGDGRCALLQPDPYEPHAAGPANDDEPTASSR